MDKTELKKLKIAIKTVKNPWDTLEFRGDYHSCRWCGDRFIWTMPSGDKVEAIRREVVEWIRDGRYITDWCYSYGDEQPDAEEV